MVQLSVEVAWIGAVSNYGINISECDSTNATTLGIPVTSVDAVGFLPTSSLFHLGQQKALPCSLTGKGLREV